jgi:molybdopterin converting factor small subunit
MLTSFTGGNRRFSVDAETVAGALAAAAAIYPMLRTHIFDEAGGVREHVQIFVNATDSRQLPSLDGPVSEGDEIIVLQAISGGRMRRPDGSLTHRRALRARRLCFRPIDGTCFKRVPPRRAAEPLETK